jgi:DNA-binding NarL/FixJ family response regulator
MTTTGPQRAAIRRAIKAGGTIRGIAKALSVTEHAVKVERIKLGGTAPDKRKSNTRTKVQLLTARGWSAARIATKLQISETVVYRYRREHK